MSTGNPQFNPKPSSSNLDEFLKSKQEVKSKQQQWQEKLNEILKPDVYGYVIDKGVQETVATLQLLGFNTTQSDQGNYSETPWIQIESEEPKDIYIGEQQLKTELMAKIGVSPNEIDQKSSKFSREKQVNIEEGAREQLEKAGIAFTPEYQEWHKRTSEFARKLQSLVDEFYSSVIIPENAKDLRIGVEFPYRAPQYRAYIQDLPQLKVKFIGGGININTLSEDERKQASADALREMKRFTEFLKERFFKIRV